ncbi:MAG: L-2-amino-thiazoline-4-carboxylic acid hydrolase [Actinobacteria bacterium]|nr:L-2-amino-thiazoline-4-carboxylic acid hydrolase [Actinomycetota bacterium]
METAKSGSNLQEVEMPPPQGEGAALSIGWPIVKAMSHSLFRGTGIPRGLGLLLKSNTWDMMANKPQWHPEYFEFSDDEQEQVFKEVFDLMRPTIILYDNLKKHYGEYLADEMMSAVAIRIQLGFFLLYSYPEDRTDIDQWRQAMANYFSSKAWESTQWVSEDKTEYRMRWTKCAPTMILKAYGLHSYARYACLAHHIAFDCLAPEVIFSVANTIGTGDPYCDYLIRIPLSEDDRKEESDYADCYKVEGGREAVRHWEEVYKRFGDFRI